MSDTKVSPGSEVTFGRDEIIVSKTDLKGRITYANGVFMRVAGYRETELLGAPHSIIRHPDMPRCVFKLLWDRIAAGEEVFAYVVNRTKTGGFYWVLAHVTPSRDGSGQIVGYHSNRRVPDRQVLDGTIRPLYAELKRIEDDARNAKQGMNAAFEHLTAKLADLGTDYDRFVWSLIQPGTAPVRQGGAA